MRDLSALSQEGLIALVLVRLALCTVILVVTMAYGTYHAIHGGGHVVVSMLMGCGFVWNFKFGANTLKGLHQFLHPEEG